VARKKGIVGLVGLAVALLAAALVPAAASAHPACGNAASSFLSLNAGLVGALPTGEVLAEQDSCTIADVEAALSQNVATTAAADPIDPLLPVFANKSANLTLQGYSARNLPLTGALAGINSDLAFRGNLAFQGHWNGFRVIDVSDPANPVQISNYEQCVHPSGQGDIVVWGNILVRTWDSRNNTGSLTCGGQSVGTSFEGIHIFNIADPANPVFVKQLRMSNSGNDPGAPTVGCGAHTATAVPDPARDNLYLYVGGSSGDCPGIDIVRIKVSDPSNAVYVRRAEAGRQCHDNNVIMGNVNLAMCAGGNGVAVFKFDPSLDPAAAGGIENPTLLFTRQVSTVTTLGHSGAFSYDGKVLVFGWEPGGGTGAACEAGDPTLNKTLFFLNSQTGDVLGTMLTQRPQGNNENCTWHNFNVVPTYKRNILVTGNYQMGISVIDFTDPTAPQEIGYADPTPLAPNLVTGGDWSTYWHNGKLYEADIRRGLLIWDTNDERIDRAKTLAGDHNPQTQMTSYEQDFGKPTIDIASPVAGSVYTKNSTVLADFSCADAETAVESCVGTVGDGAPIATGQIGHFEFKVTATDVAGNVETKTVVYSVLNTTADGNVSGTVPGTLSLTVGAPAHFGAFTAGVARQYNAGTTANVISTAGEATLSVSDPSSTATGHLVNGPFWLPSALQARARNAANPATTFADVGSSASPTNLLTYTGPVSNDAVSLDFQQNIGAGDALRTGTYSKTLTFTLSTTTP
jgi:LVIVD repeat